MLSHHDDQPSTTYLFGTPDYVVSDILEIPRYDLEGATMRIHDVVWGNEFIGEGEYDELLVRLARSPLLRRLQAVEQLTLPAQYTTIPNTSRFSRWQHVWGSLVFVRKMTEDDDRFSERDRIVMQLRTLFSDVGQTAFSHLGDWLFQEGGGTEDLHDQDLRSLLEAFGIDELLAEYGISLDETVFPAINDWVECPSPDLCVDRVDYGMREVLRWLSPPSYVHLYKNQLADPKSLFKINKDNMLEMRHIDFAKDFAMAYNLLPTEHWAQPVHRLQIELMQVAVKRSLLDGHMSDGVILESRPHPRDRLYGIDSDFEFAFHDWDGIVLSRAMRSIGLAQRQIFAEGRKHDLAKVFEDRVTVGFPDPNESLSWQSARTGLVAPQIELEEIESDDTRHELHRNGLAYALKPLKSRSIDPLVTTHTGSSRLGDLDETFATYRRLQQNEIAKHYTATLLLNKQTSARIRDIHQATNERWQEAANQPRDVEVLREIVGQAALYAAARCFDKISDW